VRAARVSSLDNDIARWKSTLSKKLEDTYTDYSQYRKMRRVHLIEV
jgi:flagellar capping protein FliD